MILFDWLVAALRQARLFIDRTVRRLASPTPARERVVPPCQCRELCGCTRIYHLVLLGLGLTRSLQRFTTLGVSS